MGWVLIYTPECSVYMLREAEPTREKIPTKSSTVGSHDRNIGCFNTIDKSIMTFIRKVWSHRKFVRDITGTRTRAKGNVLHERSLFIAAVAYAYWTTSATRKSHFIKLNQTYIYIYIFAWRRKREIYVYFFLASYRRMFVYMYISQVLFRLQAPHYYFEITIRLIVSLKDSLRRRFFYATSFSNMDR